MLEKKEKLANNIKKKKDKKATTSTLGKPLYGCMMMYAPKMGLETVEIFIAVSVSAFHVDCSFDVTKMAMCTPLAAMMKGLMIDEPVDSVLLKRE